MPASALSWSVSSIISDFSGGSVVKNLPAVQKLQEMWVQSLSQKDSLEEGMATHYSILAWRIPWTEEPDELQSIGLHRVNSTDWLSTHTPLIMLLCCLSHHEMLLMNPSLISGPTTHLNTSCHSPVSGPYLSLLMTSLNYAFLYSVNTQPIPVRPLGLHLSSGPYHHQDVWITRALHVRLEQFQVMW